MIGVEGVPKAEQEAEAEGVPGQRLQTRASHRQREALKRPPPSLPASISPTKNAKSWSYSS